MKHSSLIGSSAVHEFHELITEGSQREPNIILSFTLWSFWASILAVRTKFWLPSISFAVCFLLPFLSQYLLIFFSYFKTSFFLQLGGGTRSLEQEEIVQPRHIHVS